MINVPIVRAAALTLLCAVACLVPNIGHAQVTLSKPGVYVLTKDIKVESGDAITIAVSGVTLDLNGHTVSTEKPATGRGIFVNGVKGTSIKNGKVGPFNMNVVAIDAENLTIEDLQIAGNNLAPNGGPVEIGIMLINTRGAKIKENTLTSVNLGIFIRGGGSGGNRISNNIITGGKTGANNLLGLCYNPGPGDDPNDPAMRPTGDLITGNHIARYATAVAMGISVGNILKENTLAFFTAAYGANTLVGNTIVDDTTVQINH